MIRKFASLDVALRSGAMAGAFIALILALAGPAKADAVPTDTGPNYLRVRVLSNTEINVDFSLLGATYDGDLTSSSEVWPVGPHFTDFVGTATVDNVTVTSKIFWLEPGSSFSDPANALFGAFDLSSCFCGQAGPNVSVAIDIPDWQLNDSAASDEWADHVCSVDSMQADCPIVRNGQSVTIPIDYIPGYNPTVYAEPMTVTFTDLRDGGVAPEPATWALLILGVGLAGLTLRRRRRREAPASPIRG